MQAAGARTGERPAPNEPCSQRNSAEVDGMAEARVDSRAFRNALGRFATGVTVVTTAAAAGAACITANALPPVSPDPPLEPIAGGQPARLHSHLLPTTTLGR